MRSIILKFLFVLVSVKYPRVGRNYRYFIRDNYYCRINQVKYLIRDYVKKEAYKVTDFRGEFDQELRYVIPFAYWHHLNGTLRKTISSKNTRELYFFSNNHEERYTERLPTSNHESYEVPNMTHSISFSFRKWHKVPYKEHFRNDVFVYDKPLLVVANKYNIEWDQPPVNYLNIEDLDKIINAYGHRYQIIYNRPLSTHIVSDNSETLDLDEHAWLREKHPEVLLVGDLYDAHKACVNNFNHLQLMIYANCNRFISMHGGTAAFASCFGGVNVILSIGQPTEVHLNEFKTIFPALSGAMVLHASSKESLFSHLSKSF